MLPHLLLGIHLTVILPTFAKTTAINGRRYCSQQNQTRYLLTPQAADQLVGKLSVIPGNNADAFKERILKNAVSPLSETPVAAAEVACGVAREVFAPNTGDGTTSCEIMDVQSPGYIAQTQVHWSSNCWQTPSCILLPTTAVAVADAMAIITSTQTTFSIRGRGHNFNVNHSSVGTNGIIIDMSGLTQITLAADKSTVTVGAGLSWGDVYRFLNGTGVSVNGAHSPNPGIVGQTIGGGLGWFTGSAGITAASVVAAEVVLANSSIAVATPDNAYADLLWALKGGGPNYGVVTSFTYRTLPIDKVWGAAWLYSTNQNEKLLDALVEYQKLAEGDDKANLVLVLSPPSAPSSASLVGAFYAASDSPYPAIFAPFYNITTAATLFGPAVGTIADIAAHFDSPQYPAPGTQPTRNYVVSTSHTFDLATYRESYTAWTELAKSAPEWTTTFGSQSMSLRSIQASASTALDLDGLHQVPQDWTHITLSWLDSVSPEEDAKVKNLLREMGDAVERVAQEQGSLLAYRFMNDAYDGQDVLGGGSYGVKGRERLRDVSCRYDGGRVFQRLQNGGWLLDRGGEGCGIN